MAKRRTSRMQRRSRASEEALRRRVGTGRSLDWRLLTIIGAGLAAVGVLVVALIVGGSGNSRARGAIQPDAGQSHIQAGQVGTYTSTPATSGPHWSQAGLAPANWGVYTPSAPLPEPAALHNLEHGGIVIWYQPGKLSAADVAKLEGFVRTQTATERYKFIVSPWTGKDFGHPLATVAWRWLLDLDKVDLDALRGFADDHYGRSPEPAGGPGPPSG